LKRFDELTTEQQERAVDRCMVQLMEGIVEGYIVFNDSANKDDLQARINAACEKAAAMRTPWFAGEYILDTCKAELESLARGEAMESLYSEPEDPPVHIGIVQ
jgi:hypothetical protein